MTNAAQDQSIRITAIDSSNDQAWTDIWKRNFWNPIRLMTNSRAVSGRIYYNSV